MASKTNFTPKTIWCVYNHIPGGQLVAMKFSTYSRVKKIGGSESTEEVIFDADKQLEAWKKSDCVGLKMKGEALVKHQVFVLPASVTLPDNPAQTVLDYAISQGCEPYKNPNEQISDRKNPEAQVPDAKQQQEIDDLKKDASAMQKDVADLKKNTAENAKGISEILALLKKKEGA